MPKTTRWFKCFGMKMYATDLTLHALSNNDGSFTKRLGGTTFNFINLVNEDALLITFLGENGKINKRKVSFR